MEAKDVITAIALIAGPTIAVIITLWYQRRAEKRAAKERLFITLMAHRRASPPSAEWSGALNLIDVIYARHPRVVELWHELYDILQIVPLNMQRFGHAHLTLLSAMAQVLGYKTLTQTDIDKFYAPQVFGDQAAIQADLQKELVRVLKATQTLKKIGG